MPSVPTTTSTSPVSPAAATEPRPPGPSAPVAWASSTISRQPWSRASRTSVLQRGDVAVHREDAVGDDQRAAAARLAQPPGEVLDVAVAVDEGLGPGQPAAVDDAGVVELVGEDDARRARASAGDRAGVGEVAGAEEQRRLVALERAPAARSSRRCGAMLPEISREAPAPAPQRIAASAAAARTCGWLGEAEVVVRAEQQDRLAVEQHPRPLRPVDQAQPAVEPAVAELLQPLCDRRSCRGLARVGRRLLGLLDHPQLGRRDPRSWPRPGGRSARRSASPASRPRASPSGCRGAGWRRCRPGGATFRPSSSNIARSSSGSAPRVVRKLPIITPFSPALTASGCRSPRFSTRPPQSRKRAPGMIRRKIATHLTTSHGVHQRAVAELGPLARVEQVDRHRGRVQLGELEGHLDPLPGGLAEVEDAADAGLQPRLLDRLDRPQAALVADRGGDLRVVGAGRLDVVVDALDPGLAQRLRPLGRTCGRSRRSASGWSARRPVAPPRGSWRSRVWRGPGPG